MISKTSTRFVCGKTYGKVPIARCDDLWLVGPQQDASGNRKETKKVKYNNVVHRSYERSPTWYQANGVMGIGYSWWWLCEGCRRSHWHGACCRICGDESTHQILSYGLLFLTFYRFPYTAGPPTSTVPMRPSPTFAITADYTLYPSHHWPGTTSEISHMTYGPHQIGRASCRERV